MRAFFASAQGPMEVKLDKRYPVAASPAQAWQVLSAVTGLLQRPLGFLHFSSQSSASPMN